MSTSSGKLGPGLAPLQRNPGGDFGWLKKGYTMTIRGTTSTELAETHGHNVVAADYAYISDPTNTLAPGGTFSGAQLGCTSCHDPHGRVRRTSTGYATAAALGGIGDPIANSGSYDTSNPPIAGQAVGVYRLLRGLGDSSIGATFVGVAVAVAPATYNRTEAVTQTRVAYASDGINTWGNWCASCHPDMHSSGNYVHPIDRAMGGSGNNKNIYDAYVMSGNLSGVPASSFTSLVPFAEKTGNYTNLKAHAKNNDSYLNGPGTTDEVTCLSCHRAHASGWPEALRWNMEGEFMVWNSLYPGTDTTPTVPQFARGRLGAETQAAYYDRPVTKFATYQRVLCNKCHAKD